MSAFSSESSGLGPIIIGSIALLLIVAAWFSGLSDDLLASTSATELNEERAGRIHDQGVKLSSLQRNLIRQKKLLVEQREIVEPMLEGKRLTSELGALKDEVADLQLEASKQGDELAEVKNQKARYRARVRGRLWPPYLKRELKAEHLVGPMPFRNPKISKIDPAGLMVMHESGSARVKVSALARKFRKLLDLDVLEAERLMTEMVLKDARAKSQRTKRAGRAGQPNAAEVEGILGEKLLQVKAEVVKYADLIRRAEDAAQTAHHNDQFSSSRSVPGKLETWRERAQKFDAAAAGYRKRFYELVSEVQKLDPDFKVPKL